MYKIVLLAATSIFLSFSVSVSADAMSPILPIEDSIPCGAGAEKELIDSGIRLRPQNNIEKDFANLQSAIDQLPSGGFLELCEGIFNLGEGDHKKFIRINKGITLAGKYFNNDWQTVIHGGGGKVFLQIPTPDITVGPIFIKNSKDSEANVFDKIWFRHWTSEVIVMKKGHGLTVSNSKITHPYAGDRWPIFGYTMIHAILTDFVNADGEYNVINNTVDLKNYLGPKPSDNQLMGIIGSTWSDINIRANRIVSNDEAIEILLNVNREGTKILIEDNEIEIDFDVDGTWPMHFAMQIANNYGVDSVLVKNNKLLLKNSMSHYNGSLGAFLLTGENILLENNSVHLDNFDGALFQMGVDLIISRTMIGNTLKNSTIKNNYFSGNTSGLAYNFGGGASNGSRDNNFTISASMAATGAKIPENLGKKLTCRNNWSGEIPKTLAQNITACKE